MWHMPERSEDPWRFWVNWGYLGCGFSFFLMSCGKLQGTWPFVTLRATVLVEFAVQWRKEEPVTPPLDTLRVEGEIFVSPTADALLLKVAWWREFPESLARQYCIGACYCFSITCWRTPATFCMAHHGTIFVEMYVTHWPTIFARLTDDFHVLMAREPRQARELFATCVALPIAWLHLDADVEGSRRRKHERVKEGGDWFMLLNGGCPWGVL